MKKSLLLLKFLLLMTLPGFTAPVDDYLEKLDSFLSKKEMKKLIPDRKALNIYRLAEDEDMELTDDYLISDALLREIKRRGLINTKFGELIEEFQNECDKLNEIPRKEALARWKSLWLEKVSGYLRYLKTLKPIWTVDLNQTLDYDSNVRLRPQDDTTNTYTHKSDVGALHNLGFSLRPFINRNKNSNWNYTFKLNGSSRVQSKIEDVEYNTWGFTNSLGWNRLNDVLTQLRFSQNFERSYSRNPADPRLEFDQYTFSILAGFLPMSFPDRYFKSGSWRTTLSYKTKEEFKNDNGIKTVDEDLDIFTWKLSQNFLRIGKNIPLETLGWYLKLEHQDVSPNSYRKFSLLALGVNHSKGLHEIFKRYPLSWRSSLEVRLKDWGDARTTAGNTDPEGESQVTVSTSVRSRWTANFSSSLRLSFMRKDKDVTNAAGEDINQFKVSITNTFLTF